MTEADACGGGVAAAALEEEAAGIICSLREGDLAGWTPPWKSTPGPYDAATTKEEVNEKAWPTVTRGKRSRSSRRRSPSGSVSGSAAKGRWARGSPASPLDYSGGGCGSGASTSGGEDGAFCSPPAVAVPTPVQPSSTSSAKAASAGARRALILPVPATVLQPRPAGQRSRKKMRLPEVQQLVQSLAAENDGLRQEMQLLRRACTSLSKENSTLETRLEHSSSSKRKRIGSEEQQQQAKPRASERSAATNGFVLPDLNIPAQDITDGSAVAAP
ncbi:uncharacterized protein [Lolium perenne]|uniref:uncharacterized protein isoform X2 n=1 Tax=Lolium perenne TaxID=4522 RepID=UPI0021F58044|nr:uncharacterized protein LOC127317216 isoform X2 [Lolium perenne]